MLQQAPQKISINPRTQSTPKPKSVCLQQAGRGVKLFDVASIQDEDAVCVGNCVQTVRHRQHRALPECAPHRRLSHNTRSMSQELRLLINLEESLKP